MISELLTEGRENARTARELATYLQCDIRDISRQIEKERRAGVPICAATGDNPGYYLAADPDELDSYCRQLWKRAGEVFKTRRALLQTLQGMEGNSMED